MSQRLSLQIDQLARFKLSILGAAKDLVCLCSLILFQTTGVKVAVSKALDALVILLNEAFKGSRGYSASAFRLQQTAPCCTGPGWSARKGLGSDWELLKFHWAMSAIPVRGLATIMGAKQANGVCSRHDVVTLLLHLQAFLHLLMATEHGLQVVGFQEGLCHIHAKLLDTGTPSGVNVSFALVRISPNRGLANVFGQTFTEATILSCACPLQLRKLEIFYDIPYRFNNGWVSRGETKVTD